MPDDATKNEEFDDDKFFDEIINDLEEKAAEKREQDEDPDDSDKNNSEDDSKKIDDDPDKDKSSKQNSQPSLEEKLALLEKENKGLKNAAVEYRQDRARFKTRLDEITQLIKESKEQRGAQTGGKNTDGSTGDDASKNKVNIDKLPIEYDEESGKAFVPADAIKQLLAEDIQNASKKTERLERALQEKDQVAQLQDAFHKHVSDVLERGDGRDEAYEKLTNALKLLDNKVIELQRESGQTGRLLEKGVAIDLLSKTDGALDEFKKLDLPVSHAEVIRMFDSDFVFENTLDTVAKSLKKEAFDSKTDDDKLLENLKSKPASPGKSRSAKSTETVLDKITGYSPEDLLDLDDKTWDRVLSLVEKETEE